MPHIALPPNVPGIGGAFAFRPETARPMRELAHVLLFEPGGEASLSSRDRELIASYVSSRNNCYFCQTSHGAAAASHAGGSAELVAAVWQDPETAEISPKLKALLAIAGQVQGDAKGVSEAHIEAARLQGATDLEIHDTVLIAAAFCMYNRYVDGLGTWQPRDEDMYRAMGKQLAEQGYARR
ncbi:peroxidase-related enzyme [Granulicella sp. 5B5]|uniref:carboxymuconolactone decarboxylase family protein n=1 Tax=Granulicella sp. 5B5 TaxID=1617967 RepID=UPI0015F65B12|nr:peroxidase-related enzyme [Granulicella sp. 5B5]QMV19355.1 peroxidase-related enzyme [Granulicella sp. 5B5]